MKDYLKILERDSKARKREAERGSGISPKYHEIAEIMDDHLQRSEEEEAKLTDKSTDD